MNVIHLSPTKPSVNAEVTVPGSKSYTNRALLLASIAHGLSRLSGVAMSTDSEAMVSALQLLGVSVHLSTDDNQSPALIVEGCGGRFHPYEGVIDVGAAGTTMRFLTALCASIPGASITLQGSPRMHERPIEELVTALNRSGAQVAYLNRYGCPPLHFSTKEPLCVEAITIDGSTSSQFVSALLLTAALRTEGLTLTVSGHESSRSYITMTLQSLRDFGVAVTTDGAGTYHVAGGQTVHGRHYTIEGDGSGASYLWGLAAVSGGSVTVNNINPDSAQGDIAFPNVLARMGCRVQNTARSITVSAPHTLEGVEVDMTDMPDTAQTLAVIAACARGTTVIRGLRTLRIKETDRIAALHTELGRVGITSEAGPDYLIVHGGSPAHACIKTYDDHRMAMSFALLGARTAGVSIEDPQVVNKSFMSFWETLRTMGLKLTR
jgi:3-phosphoshikimate 1-carboxyvinyltransferase